MNDADRTWALVVGIDRYDLEGLKKLEGAAADAVAAVTWLRALGVPDDNIFVHASPSKASRKKLDDLKLSRPDRGATEDEIWSSVHALSQVTNGKRLFVFLSGHGLYEPAGKRLFLTQDFGVADMWARNWGLDRYCDYFLSMAFEHQFLFMDGCQNFPYPETARTKISPGFPGPTDTTPKASNSLVACFAGGIGQRAAEIGRRGAFMRPLLEAMDPKAPLRRAVHFDFDTGGMTLDLNRLFGYLASTVQEDAAAQQPPLTQVPQAEPKSAAPATGPWPVFRFEEVTTRKIELDVQPQDAARDVEELRVFCRDRDWILLLPRGRTLKVPWPAHLPSGQPATAACSVKPGTGWQPLQAEREILEEDTVVKFDLAPPFPPPPPPGAPAPAGPPPSPPVVFSVKTTKRDGEWVPAMEPLYGRISRRLRLPKPKWGASIRPGVRMYISEDGPEFVTSPAKAPSVALLAGQWADLARKLTSQDVAVSTTISAPTWPSPPNLVVQLPATGAAAMAGVLAEHEVMSVGPPGAPEKAARRMSLADLQALPGLQVPPGPVEVRLTLPWGSWSTVVAVPTSGQATVDLPETVGQPPLRVQLREELHGEGFRILGVSGDRPTGSLRAGLFAPNGPRLAMARRGGAAWALTVPEAARGPMWLGGTIAVLEANRQVLFPLRAGRSIGVDLAGGGVRVEPLSYVDAPEWDALVATGRLDVLSKKDAVALAEQKWFDELLGLAAAYALYASRSWRHLEVVLGNLPRVNLDVVDTDLLRVALVDRRRKGLSKGSVDLLLPRADRGEVPLMRWGMDLALNLLERAPMELVLEAWQHRLQALAGSLSPASVWTAWTE